MFVVRVRARAVFSVTFHGHDHGPCAPRIGGLFNSLYQSFSTLCKNRNPVRTVLNQYGHTGHLQRPNSKEETLRCKPVTDPLTQPQGREKSIFDCAEDTRRNCVLPKGAGLKNKSRWDVCCCLLPNACCLENRLMQLNPVRGALM